MLPAISNAPAPERSAGDLLDDYTQHQIRTGRGNSASAQGAKSFLGLWPRPGAWAELSLADRLAEHPQTTSILMFLMAHGWLHPGYDYLVERKLSSFWREARSSPLGAEMDRFLQGATEIGFTPIVAYRVASQSIGRLLIQTGRPLEALTLADLDQLSDACRARQRRTGQGWHHYRSAINAARRVLFHLEIVDSPPPNWELPKSLSERVRDVHPALEPAFVAYLERKTGTCRVKTVSSLATRLMHFGRFLAQVDPELSSLAELDRRRHIEPYLNSVANAMNSKNGQPITTADQARRILAVANFLTDITEWGWDDAPHRRLVFKSDMPRLPRPLPRYLPIDADRRLGEALINSNYRLAADALLVARATGLRIGELLDLELDCVHEIYGNGTWLKVPLGKLDTERMVPLDDETLVLIDQIVATRSSKRPLPHPRTGRPAEFLFTHHGRRLSQNALRQELDRAAVTAGIGHVTPHQLRHTYATAMVNAGVSLQSLMALLGHVSAEMSLRYGRLFDTTVRSEYEKALNLAKSRLGPMPSGRAPIPVTDDCQDWRDSPRIKTRLGGGYCLRAPVQGSCTYANICEHCANFRSGPSHLSVLIAQRDDCEALAIDAQSRGWTSEAERHRRLMVRLNTFLCDNGT